MKLLLVDIALALVIAACGFVLSYFVIVALG